MKANHILIVEDELEIAELTALHLKRHNYDVTMVSEVSEALEKVKTHKIDLIVLDWMLPGESGVDLVKKLKDLKISVPVLMLTAKTAPEDIVLGIDSGADDFVTKPFEPAVLMARVKALLRRSDITQAQSRESLELGPIRVNLSSYETRIKGQPIHLTPSEFKILSTMLLQPGKVMTRDHLVNIIQGEGINVTGRTVDTHVFGLRKKIGDQGELIETIRGVGYRFNNEVFAN